MFLDCKSDLEKNQYKRSGKLKEECDKWCQENHPEYLMAQREGSYNDAFFSICSLVEIPKNCGRFLYFIDYRFLFDTIPRGYRFENLTPGYEKVLDSGFQQLKYQISENSSQFARDYNRTIDTMVMLTERICEAYSGEDDNSKRISGYFSGMVEKPACGFEEALQRLLFINQLFWQMGHRLIGLGQLDKMLIDYYRKDTEKGELTKEEAEIILEDFIKILHDYYWLKSNVLMGDTGQIILLDGNEPNELTFMIFEIIEKIKLPDPKLLLRVSEKVDQEILVKALKCAKSGVGSPIFANDDAIIPRLTDFGLPKDIAMKYGVSACWEPLVPGKSVSLNNIAYLSFPEVFLATIEDPNTDSCADFAQLMEVFYCELKTSIDRILSKISAYRLQYNPLLSIFTDDCKAAERDVSQGGAEYSNYGITTVGLSNAVNSLLNIKKLVFTEKRFTVAEVRELINSDFADEEILLMELKNFGPRYGNDNEMVIDFTNEVLGKLTELCKDYRNYLGGRIKFGVSAPTYVDAAVDFPATFDGRKRGEPFGVHISQTNGSSYTEVINFASAIDYGENRFNGNVVDLTLSPDILGRNLDQVKTLIMVGIKKGFFELQMNVVSSEMLIKAKRNPELYPNLIVRVWGFCAYFNDIPDSYKDVLIKRAMENERITSY